MTSSDDPNYAVFSSRLDDGSGDDATAADRIPSSEVEQSAPPQNDRLLTDMRQWLQSALDEMRSLSTGTAIDSGTAAGSGSAPDSVGLMDVVAAFTALRQDIKLQTKSVRALQETAESAILAMQAAAGQFESVEPREAETARQVSVPMAESMADLYEALYRMQDVMKRGQQRSRESIAESADLIRQAAREKPFWKRIFLLPFADELAARTEQQFCEIQEPAIASLLEGLELVLRRLERAMRECELEPVKCLNRPVDVNCMTVLEAVETDEHPAGTVIGVVREGYRYRGQILRFAEVRATSTSTESTYSKVSKPTH